MTKKLAIAAVLMVTSCLHLHAQTSPIKISGSMDCGKPNKAGVVTIKNISSKMVLAYVIAVTNLCFPRHEIYRHDYFFKPVGFAADNTDQWELAPPGTEISEMASPAKADFQGEVLFVQLADGSTWGSPDAGKELLAQRTEVEKFLKRLNDVAGDEKKFLQILGEKQPTQTSVSAVSGHLGMMEKEGGMQAVVSNVRQRLEIAQERHKLIK